MPSDLSPQEIVLESALQLWAAAQTDFDPYSVPPDEWKNPVPVTEADIATDTGLDLDTVRECLRGLAGSRLVVGDDDGTVVVTSIVPADEPF